MGLLDPPAAYRPAASREIRWEWLGFAAVAMLQVALALIHSPWRDETEALLVARLPLGRLLEMLHYEGHPSLWYLLLAAASRISASPLPLQVVQALVALGSQAILWRRAPFSWPTKLLVSLGYFILFEYGAIARNYGLGVLLFFAFVALRRTRWSWLLLALMCNTAVHVAVMAGVGALILIFVERRWSWSGAALLILSGLIAMASVIPAPDALPKAAAGHAPLAHFMRALVTTAADIAPVRLGQFPASWLWRPPAPWDVALGVMTPLLGVWVLRRDWRLAGAYLLFWLGLMVIGVAVYPIQVRHAGLLVVLLIGLLWIQKDRTGADPGAVARLWLVSLAAGGIWMAGCSLFQPFSYARPLADWVRERKLASEPWAALPGFLGSDLTGQFGRPTFNVQKGCWNAYQRWNYDYDDRPRGMVLGQRLEAYAEAVGPAYLMTDTPLDAGSDVRTRRVATFSGAMFSQTDPRPSLFVYRIDPRVFIPRTLPTCR